MKLTPIILLFLLALTGCYHNKAVEATLRDAEILMESHPDSAYAILQTIDPTTIKSEQQCALYALLYSQALDKNYIDETNDSLISIAENFYIKGHNIHYLMLSYYYHGRIKYNAKEYAKGLCLMTKAFDYAENLNDSYWMGRIAGQISNIYDDNFHGTEAIHYAKIAYDNIKISGKQPFLNHSLLQLARVYLNNQKNDMCIAISKQLLDSAYIYQDSLLNISALRLLAKSYINNGEHAENIKTINAITEITEPSSDLRCLLGLSYLAIGEHQKAYEILNNISENYTNPDFVLMYEIAKINGDNNTALFAIEKVFNEVDSVFKSSMNQNFSQTLSELYSQENKRQETKLKQIKTNYITTVILCSIAIALILAVFNFAYRRQKEKIERNILIARGIQDILTVTETQFTEAQEAVRTLLMSRFSIVDSLCKTYYENQSIGLAKKRISEEVETLIEQFSTNEQKILELENLANKYYSNLITSFRTDFPKIKKADYLLFLYTVLGFSITAIALFLKEDKVSAVYNRKARLKNKILLLDISKRDMYSRFL